MPAERRALQPLHRLLLERARVRLRIRGGGLVQKQHRQIVLSIYVLLPRCFSEALLCIVHALTHSATHHRTPNNTRARTASNPTVLPAAAADEPHLLYTGPAPLRSPPGTARPARAAHRRGLVQRRSDRAPRPCASRTPHPCSRPAKHPRAPPARAGCPACSGGGGPSASPPKLVKSQPCPRLHAAPKKSKFGPCGNQTAAGGGPLRRTSADARTHARCMAPHHAAASPLLGVDPSI